MSAGRIILNGADAGIARAVEADTGDWAVSQVLSTVRVTSLVSDPTNHTVIYAGTREHGVWRSENQGETWEQQGLTDQHVKSLAVSPHDPNIIYAGTKPAWMFRSKDVGQTWEELEAFRRIPNRWWWFSPADQPGWDPYVIEIAVSPTTPGVILAGVELGAVVRSEDGGETWSRHLRGTLRDCHSLKFHPLDGNYAYEAGGTGGGASVSRDGGRTWEKSKQGLAKSYGIVCGADGVDPNTWYACVGASPGNAFAEDPNVYLYRSNGSGHWMPIGWDDHPLQETPTVMVSVPGSSGELYIATQNGSVWHTLDFGASWSRLPVELDGVRHSLLVLHGG